MPGTVYFEVGWGHALLDYLIGAGHQRWRDAEAKRAGGLEIDYFVARAAVHIREAEVRLRRAGDGESATAGRSASDRPCRHVVWLDKFERITSRRLCIDAVLVWGKT
jgi:hypothetical protein